MKISRRTLFVYGLSISLGALAGYLYYHFAGCTSGTCPLVSRPLPAMVYGSLFGAALGTLFAPGKKKKQQDTPEE